jgi:hypothetical protein
VSFRAEVLWEFDGLWGSPLLCGGAARTADGMNAISTQQISARIGASWRKFNQRIWNLW